ncbi:hypothetical protein ACYOEI_30965 [Singulisphaera rosea]
MNPIQKLQRFLLTAFSDAKVTLDEPLVAEGVWSMNVFLSEYHLAAALQVGRGFGVVSRRRAWLWGGGPRGFR